MYALEYEYTPHHKSDHAHMMIEVIPFDFFYPKCSCKIFPIGPKRSNWSAQSTAFSVMQAKVCKPYSVSKVIPFGFPINNILVKCSNLPNLLHLLGSSLRHICLAV